MEKNLSRAGPVTMTKTEPEAEKVCGWVGWKALPLFHIQLTSPPYPTLPKLLLPWLLLAHIPGQTRIVASAPGEWLARSSQAAHSQQADTLCL